MQVLGFADYAAQGKRLAEALSVPYRQIEVHRFPDGESLVTLPLELAQQLIICRSLDAPNSKLIELLLAVEAAREQGVREITLVAPYLCYMRQDKAFHAGEAISQRSIGAFLGRLFDRVITVDAHLHRVQRLEQALPGTRAINLSATPLMSEFLSRQPQRPLLVGPDVESRQWVDRIARAADCDSVVAQKLRLGDRQVQISLPQRNYEGERIVLIDDIISTGHTLMRIARILFEAGAAGIDALVTHALHDEATATALRTAGIGQIWSCDSVSHASNSLQLARLLAAAIQEDVAASGKQR